MSTNDLAAQASEIAAALEEARDAYNTAKRDLQESVQLSRRTLYLLTLGAARGFGVPLYDATSGAQLHDPGMGSRPNGPSVN